MSEGRPQCGSGDSAGEDNMLGLHIGAIFLVLAASIFGAGFPVVAKKVPWMRIPPWLFFMTKHFGTGVLIATAFVHLLPTAFGSLSNPCLPPLLTEQYPAMPGVIMMGALFVLFAIEMWLNGKIGKHSHGGNTGADIVPHQHQHQHAIRRMESFESDEDWIEKEKQYARNLAASTNSSPSEMPPWFIVFYEQYVRQREQMMKMIEGNKQPEVEVAETYREQNSEEEAVDPLVLKKMNYNISLLEGGILFHSVFVGMTISITTDGFITLLVAIMFHQLFEGLGLGSRIAAVPYAKKSIRPWVLVVAFGITCPFGQFLGIVTRGSYDPESEMGLILVGVFNAISSGLLIYAALVDLLAEDFLSEEGMEQMKGNKKYQAFFWVLLGAAGMSIVGAFA